MAPHTDIKHRERVEFARDVADGLKQALAAEKWHALEIFASNPFVGELRAHMNPDVQKTGHNIHPLDLTSLTAQEIETRWRQEFRV